MSLSDVERTGSAGKLLFFSSILFSIHTPASSAAAPECGDIMDALVKRHERKEGVDNK